MGLKYSNLSPRQTGELLKLFVSGSTARAAGEMFGVHRNTAALFFTKIRRLIAEYQELKMSEAFEGAVEINESYFGGKRKGISGKGAAGKVAVFGILKRGGSVYAQMIANCGRAELVPIIRRKVSPASVVFSDSWGGYDTLSVEGYHHERINHDHELVDSKGRHINGIENFWNQAKRHLRKFNGVPKSAFPLFLQECVWRFNTGGPLKQLVFPRKLMRR